MYVRRAKRIAVMVVMISLCTLVSHGQGTKPNGARTKAILSVEGKVTRPLKLSLNELTSLTQHPVQVNDPDGTTHTYEGPVLADVLRLSGVVFGEELKGRLLTMFLLVRGADHFQTVFTLPELDSTYTDRLVILAVKRDGNLLDTTEGPLRMVVLGEKRRSRWAKQVTTLTVRDAVDGIRKTKSGR